VVCLVHGGKDTHYFENASVLATFFALSATFCDCRGALEAIPAVGQLLKPCLLQSVAATRRSRGAAAERGAFSLARVRARTLAYPCATHTLLPIIIIYKCVQHFVWHGVL
jgi:hypothetical protein